MMFLVLLSQSWSFGIYVRVCLKYAAQCNSHVMYIPGKAVTGALNSPFQAAKQVRYEASEVYTMTIRISPQPVRVSARQISAYSVRNWLPNVLRCTHVIMNPIN